MALAGCLARKNSLAHAGHFFTMALDHILVGNVDLVSENIRLVLIDTGQYTVDLDNDQYLANIPSAARVANSPQGLTGKTVVDGAFDADDHRIPHVLGASVEAYAYYQWTEASAPVR